ncbi:MAG: creatininase family protein [Chloroflexota bacterium]
MAKYLFRDLTWPDVNECVKERRVVLLPVGAIEQHGPHLPIDMDNVGVEEACLRAGALAPSLLLVMPPVHYGWVGLGHDFPGTISISTQHFIGYITDVCLSLARMGFVKVMLVNGHGGNRPFLEAAARDAMAQTDAHVALATYWELAREAVNELRESRFPGGMAHSCEFETSVYMACRPELVKTELIQKEMYEGEPRRWLWGDLMADAPVRIMDVAGRLTRSGVAGDPTKASAAKGEAFLKLAAENLAAAAREFSEIPIRPRVSHLVSPD